jgi:hypothetical protein
MTRTVSRSESRGDWFLRVGGRLLARRIRARVASETEVDSGRMSPRLPCLSHGGRGYIPAQKELHGIYQNRN